MVSSDTLVDQRPFYFSHIEVDPKNPDRVYGVSRSAFGQHRRRQEIQGNRRSGSRRLPRDLDRARTIRRGSSSAKTAATRSRSTAARTGFSPPIWRSGKSIASGSGNDNPYTVCAGLQDNNGWCGPSNSLDPSGIQNKDWIVSVGGDGEWGIPDPTTQTGSGRIPKTARSSFSTASPKTDGLRSRICRTRRNRSTRRSASIGLTGNRRSRSHRGIRTSPGTAATSIFQTTDRGRSWTRDQSRPHAQRQGAPEAVGRTRSPTTSRAPNTATRCSTSRARRPLRARSGSAPTTGSFR